MDVVYAMASGHIGGPDGLMLMVRKGTHWLSSDPVVRANPATFSADPRWGLCSTVPVPEPAAAAEVAEPTSAGRRRAVPA